MKRPNFQNLSIQQLVSEFVNCAKELGHAVLDSEVRQANRMVVKRMLIDKELRSRGLEARLSLQPLLDCRNRFVRYYAAKSLLGIVPGPARAIIEEIAKHPFDALGGDAGMTLFNLDEGIFKPN